MIKLKSEVNKSKIMRELRAEANERYDNAYEGEYAIEQFLLGAESLFKKLCIGAVMPSCEGNCGMNYCDDNGCIERKRILVEPKNLPEHGA